MLFYKLCIKFKTIAKLILPAEKLIKILYSETNRPVMVADRTHIRGVKNASD